MKVSEIMSRDVTTARPSDTIRACAQRMGEIDAGSLPICDGEQLTGILTDRDIVLRAVGEGRSFDGPVADIMSGEVVVCASDDEASAAADKMASAQIRRLPVVDGGKLVGIVALADVARHLQDKPAGQTLEGISRPARG